MRILFAQAYGSDMYGGDTYTCGTNCETVTPPAPETGAPNTGLLAAGPVPLIAVGIAVAVIIAAAVVIVKTALNRRKKEGK